MLLRLLASRFPHLYGAAEAGTTPIGLDDAARGSAINADARRRPTTRRPRRDDIFKKRQADATRFPRRAATELAPGRRRRRLQPIAAPTRSSR